MHVTIFFRDLGVEVRDFGSSWRDGIAFLAIIDAIKSNLINLAAMRQATNKTRLETAFNVAESELGIARLLDPEDVDVAQPDEKSIMTYVAQFLHKYPEPRVSVHQVGPCPQWGIIIVIVIIFEQDLLVIFKYLHVRRSSKSVFHLISHWGRVRVNISYKFLLNITHSNF